MRLLLLQGQCVPEGLRRRLRLRLGPSTGLRQHLRSCWGRVRGFVGDRLRSWCPPQRRSPYCWRHQHAAVTVTAAGGSRCVLRLLLLLLRTAVAVVQVRVRVRVLHSHGARAEGRLLLPLLHDLQLRRQVCPRCTGAVEAARLTYSRLLLR